MHQKSHVFSAECKAGFGFEETTGTCSACVEATYKSNIANTTCLDLPPGTSVPADLVVEGGNTGYSEYGDEPNHQLIIELTHRCSRN